MALDPMIENLLVLQDRDVRKDEIESRLTNLPLQIASIEREIAAREAKLNEVLQAHKELELKKRDLELQSEQADAQRAKFRTQQLAVKKNDEYAAMEKQIEAAAELIDELDTKIIEVMLEIDESAVTVEQEKEKATADIDLSKGNIASLKRLEESVKADLAGAQSAEAEARAKVSSEAISTYTYVKGRVRRPPYIVPVEDQHCMGCHLKVSADVLAQARLPGELTRCDSCGRIVYMDR